MSRQRHDQGNRKRRAREAAQTITRHTPEHHARDLVRRGLARPDILEGRARRGDRVDRGAHD